MRKYRNMGYIVIEVIVIRVGRLYIVLDPAPAHPHPHSNNTPPPAPPPPPGYFGLFRIQSVAYTTSNARLFCKSLFEIRLCLPPLTYILHVSVLYCVCCVLTFLSASVLKESLEESSQGTSLTIVHVILVL